MSSSKRISKRCPSIVRWVLWVVVVQLTLINISSAFYAYRLTHFSTDSSLSSRVPSQNIFVKTWRLFTGPRMARSVLAITPEFPYSTINFKTKSGLNIEAWYATTTDSVSKGTVVLVHGITVTKSTLLNEAFEYRSLGFNVLLLDLRGHGNSAGNITSIGFAEAEEVKLAVEYLQSKSEKHIVLHGASLGAVVVANAVYRYHLKPDAVVLDMPFYSLQSYLKNKADNLGFPKQPFAFLATFWIGVERGYNGFNHCIARYVKNMPCPVLMQWGKLDSFIGLDETSKIYEAINSSNKKLVIYETAGHEPLAAVDPLKWRIEIERLLKQ